MELIREKSFCVISRNKYLVMSTVPSYFSFLVIIVRVHSCLLMYQVIRAEGLEDTTEQEMTRRSTESETTSVLVKTDPLRVMTGPEGRAGMISSPANISHVLRVTKPMTGRYTERPRVRKWGDSSLTSHLKVESEICREELD